MDTQHLVKIRENLSKLTWLNLSWLPEDCPDGYPDNPKEYQISDSMHSALESLKTEIYNFIEKHYDVLVAIRDPEQRSYTIYDSLEGRIDEVAGDYGATDTASREALLYKLDEVF